MRAHLSLEHKYFPAIMTNGCSLVSPWERNSNDDSNSCSSSSSDGSNNNGAILHWPSIVAGTHGFRSASFLDN